MAKVFYSETLYAARVEPIIGKASEQDDRTIFPLTQEVAMCYVIYVRLHGHPPHFTSNLPDKLQLPDWRILFQNTKLPSYLKVALHYRCIKDVSKLYKVELEGLNQEVAKLVAGCPPTSLPQSCLKVASKLP